MSVAGRRRPEAVRLAATATALTLVAAIAVPAALVPDGSAAAGGGAKAGRSAQQAMTAPVDQIRAREWHLNAMRVPRAWKWTRGEGVTVAVLDTGVDQRHPDLTGQVTDGPDLTGGGRRPGGRYWGLHGTSMASIIAGHGNGPGQQRGVIGVAPGSRILSIRVTWENDDPQRQNGGRVTRNRDAVAQGIRYAVDHGAHIINMSLGGGRLFYDGNSTEESAIRYALNKGVVLIASAGNDGAGENRNNFPAAYRGVIAVGALDRRLKLWKDSNRRQYVAVCAPGVEIVSADSGNGYVVGTGTSPSSAIVAGVAALVRAQYPKLTPEEVRQALIEGAAPRRPTGSSTCTGPLDAVRALAAAGKLNRTAGAPSAQTGRTSPPPAPYAQAEEDDAGTLLAAVLGGGGLLIAVGVLLGWRQRRRPEYDEEGYGYGDGEDEYDYGFGAPREPVNAMARPDAPDPSVPPIAPVNAPLWQSNEVYTGPPPVAESPAGPWPPPPAERTEPPLRQGRNEPPFRQGRGDPAGHAFGDLNGGPPPLPPQVNGDTFDGPGGDPNFTVIDDEEWERFRRSALEGTTLDGNYPPSREESRPGPPVPPGDDEQWRPRPGDPDEYRPPWW